MIEDIPTPVEETKIPSPLNEIQKRILYASVVLILMGAAFVAGRYSVQTKPAASDPFAQVPTPPPMDTAPIAESAFTMINFTGVSEAKKAQVLSAFNSELCGCNCKMTVAACIIKDLNCPFWKDHVTMLQKALGNGKKPDLSKAPQSLMSMPPGSTNQISFPGGVGKK